MGNILFHFLNLIGFNGRMKFHISVFVKICDYIPEERNQTYFHRDQANTAKGTAKTKTFPFYPHYFLIITPNLYSKL